MYCARREVSHEQAGFSRNLENRIGARVGGSGLSRSGAGTECRHVRHVGGDVHRGDSNAFIPVNNTIAYRNDIALTGTDGDFTAGPQLPSGALLDSIQWTFCSEGASTSGNHGMQLVRRDGLVIKGFSRGADPIGPGCTTVTDDLSALGIVVDNQQNRVELTLTPSFAADQFNVGVPVTKEQLQPDQFTVAVIAYRLQVSPAPASATFGDVPTSHPLFQYVEALAAAGITGGCGRGNFCPDAPLTRGQMAVFLAKALGLQWH